MVAESGDEVGGEFVMIPQVRGQISAGGGVVADDIVEMRIAFRRDWIGKEGNPDNTLRIISDNPLYETFEVKPSDVVVNGKVIWFGRGLER